MKKKSPSHAEETRAEVTSAPVQKRLIAKRGHVLHQNDFHLDIAEGDDLSEKSIPDHLLVALRSEGVI